jgi:uncharacterized protein (TIGR02611 family)
MEVMLTRFLGHATYRQARRVVVLVAGATVLLLGAAMLVLPGPGIVTLVLGLSILAAEFAWARRWLAEIKRRSGDAASTARNWMNGTKHKAASGDRPRASE